MLQPWEDGFLSVILSVLVWLEVRGGGVEAEVVLFMGALPRLASEWNT